jgi:antirestriction protein ArdC
MIANRTDVYTRITQSIIAAIEAGTAEFKMPWHHNGTATSRPVNLASKKPYRGVNVLALWAAADHFGFSKGLWGTYRQWQAEGAQVRKGEKGSTVVLWKQSGTPDASADCNSDTDAIHRRFFAQSFTIFNVDQIDNYTLPQVPTLNDADRFQQADQFIANLGIKCVSGDNQAYYKPSTDTVHMPDYAQFKDAASYAAVLVHEHGHATGASHRLGRDQTGSFGSESYAAEEICVEILSGFILADLAIAHTPRADHAAYISCWLKKLRDDSRAIFKAASQAQLAADWMHARQTPALPTSLAA